MSDDQNSADSCENFIREILAALKHDEWSAEEIAEIELEVERGDYDLPEWLAKLPGMVSLLQQSHHPKR